MEKKLHRDEQHKVVAGVCAGLADYLNIDVTVIRILFLISLILHGAGGIVYIVLWIALPAKNLIFTDSTVDYKVPPSPFGVGNPFGNVPPQNQSNAFTGIPPRNNHFRGSVLAGAVLIVIGTAFLLNQFDLIPDWDFSQLWPLILIAIGASFMVNSTRKQPWEKAGWHTTDTGKKEETTNDNPSNI